MKKVQFTETVLRDANQSLIATRLPYDKFEPILEKMDQAGFYSVECWGGATFDVCLRFLNEDPWERLRKIRAKMPNTKLQMLLRGQNILGYKHYPDDVVRRFVRASVKNGIDIIRIFDALNDTDNLKVAIEETIKQGAMASGTISYTTSPVHTTAKFVEMVKELKQMGVSSICIKDMAGIMTPKSAYDLVSGIKDAVDLPVVLHTHCTTGLAFMTYLKGIEAGADGPTAIFLTTKLAPHLLGPIAIAAYSYMALIPLIQPPLMKLCTTKEMREVKMEQAREVSKAEKIIFPIVVATFVILLLPSTAPLVGCLMLGNLFRECGVTDRLSDTAQNALMNIVTIFLATSVGATMVAQNFLSGATIKIIILGLCAFAISTIGGLLGGVVMYYASGKKINPLIGSAGVSAVPMAARVSQDVGRKYNKTNFLLMHAMGPNVAGVIGSAIAAGFLLSVFGG